MKPSLCRGDDLKLFLCTPLSSCWIITRQWTEMWQQPSIALRATFHQWKALLQNALALTSARGCWCESFWCSVYSSPACWKVWWMLQTSAAQGCFYSSPLPSITLSIFSFHSPAPLLLSYTSLPLSFSEPTNLLLCGFLISLSFFDLIFIPPSPDCSVSQHKLPSLCDSRCMLQRAHD